jgi:SAM-dependent methyltransferase
MRNFRKNPLMEAPAHLTLPAPLSVQGSRQIYQLAACINCGHTSYDLYASYDDNSIYECRECSLMIRQPLPSLDILKTIYGPGYYENENLLSQEVNFCYGYLDYRFECAINRPERISMLKKIRKLLNTSRPLLLDFGCGFGDFLLDSREQGFEAYGIELSGFARSEAKAAGLDVRPYTSLRTIATFKKKFDVITGIDVVEHLLDPLAFLEQAYVSLAPGGVLVLTTMDMKSLIARLMKNRFEDAKRIDHVYFFSKKNLIELLQKVGFEILEAKSCGRTFSLQLLASRLQPNFPTLSSLVRAFLSIFSFMKNLRIRINPLTKFVIFARRP